MKKDGENGALSIVAVHADWLYFIFHYFIFLVGGGAFSKHFSG